MEMQGRNMHAIFANKEYLGNTHVCSFGPLDFGTSGSFQLTNSVSWKKVDGNLKSRQLAGK